MKIAGYSPEHIIIVYYKMLYEKFGERERFDDVNEEETENIQFVFFIISFLCCKYNTELYIHSHA